ncbi:MAG: tyrosine-type recombinase/integrase [Terracidiphilus sp.]
MYCSDCISVCRQDQKLIQDFSGDLKGFRGCSEQTVLTYRHDLDQFASHLFDRAISLLEVTGQHIKAFLQFIEGNGISRRTAVRKLYALRTFYKWLVKEELVSHNPTAFVTLKKNWSNKPRSRSVEAVQEILDNARRRARSPHRSERTRLLAIRDWAIMELLYGTGVRRAECCELDLFELNTEDLTVHVFEGKGAKDRLVSITPAACEAVQIYQEHSRKYLLERQSKKHPASRALFLTWSGTRMRPGSINRLTKGRMTPHEFRHSTAQHMTDRGASLSHVQEQCGHASPGTTAIYAGNVSFERLKEDHKIYHPRRRSPGDEQTTDSGENSPDKESRQ